MLLMTSPCRAGRTTVFICSCVTFDVRVHTEVCAWRSDLVQVTGTVALQVKYRFHSLFTLEHFLPMECK